MEYVYIIVEKRGSIGFDRGDNLYSTRSRWELTVQLENKVLFFRFFLFFLIFCIIIIIFKAIAVPISFVLLYRPHLVYKYISDVVSILKKSASIL